MARLKPLPVVLFAAALMTASIGAGAQQQGVRIVLPAHIDAACVTRAAQDFGIRADVLLGMVYVESRGKSAVGKNTNGTIDCGVAQQNYGGAGWGTHLQSQYGITCEDMLRSPCQSIRAQAYVLRREMDGRCKNSDVWCAVARYHSPGNAQLQQVYLDKVWSAVTQLHATGRFGNAKGAATTAATAAQAVAPAAAVSTPSVSGAAPGRRVVIASDEAPASDELTQQQTPLQQ